MERVRQESVFLHQRAQALPEVQEDLDRKGSHESPDLLHPEPLPQSLQSQVREERDLSKSQPLHPLVLTDQKYEDNWQIKPFDQHV